MLLALIRKELLVLSRDVHGLAALFLLPAVFIVVMSLALQDYYDPPLRSLSYAIDNRDGGAPAGQLARDWAAAHGTPQPLPADWNGQLHRGTLKYVVVLDAQLSDELRALGLPTQARVHLLAEPGIDGNLLNALRAELLGLAGELKARHAMLEAGALPPPANASVAALVDAARVAAPGVRPTAVQQNVPAWLVFGMFFIVASLSNLYIQERANGTLARLRSLGVRPHTLLLSKALPYLAVNLLQVLLMLGVGIWLMPWLGGDALSLAGVDWLALFCALGAISAAAVGLSLALAGLVRTPGQAATLGPALNVLMAALGGIMVPTFVMPAFMQRVASLSPMNWGLEALLSVLLRGGGLAQVMPQVIRLLLLAVAAGACSAWLFRRRG
ncbi:ABC transporter permease [Variovorax sp.]|uniref:ABC transporter permease n=1 Tax=Variovorax sp. TaxID=1871043 RepID=UPI002D5BE796|nr:ABC transporter permease [Variovorax sp.]HYP85098.1 ABC transporter permease [Variovorax sp.]